MLPSSPSICSHESTNNNSNYISAFVSSYKFVLPLPDWCSCKRRKRPRWLRRWNWSLSLPLLCIKNDSNLVPSFHFWRSWISTKILWKILSKLRNQGMTFCFSLSDIKVRIFFVKFAFHEWTLWKILPFFTLFSNKKEIYQQKQSCFQSVKMSCRILEDLFSIFPWFLCFLNSWERIFAISSCETRLWSDIVRNPRRKVYIIFRNDTMMIPSNFLGFSLELFDYFIGIIKCTVCAFHVFVLI